MGRSGDRDGLRHLYDKAGAGQARLLGVDATMFIMAMIRAAINNHGDPNVPPRRASDLPVGLHRAISSIRMTQLANDGKLAGILEKEFGAIGRDDPGGRHRSIPMGIRRLVRRFGPSPSSTAGFRELVFAILDPTLVSKAGPRFEGRKD